MHASPRLSGAHGSLARAAMQALLGVLALVAFAPRAQAGGFDTPILYSARHMGMGGTAIGYVDDPSALFHNPAGLAGVQGLEVLGDFSLLTGKITSSPGGFYDAIEMEGEYPSRTSNLVVAPGFLLGAGYRLSDWLVAGLAAFPVASATGEYETTGMDFTANAPRKTINRTSLLFMELTPGVTFELPFGLSLGVGYRVTYAALERVQGWKDDPGVFDFEASGVDAKGFRVGAQWRIDSHFSVGAVYRHRIEPELTADKGIALEMEFRELETTFVLPAKLGMGGRADFGSLGVALDVEYGLYSQNRKTQLEAEGLVKPVDNVFEWQNAFTVRVGGEWRVLDQLPVRIGYVFDGQVGNKHYPSAFGTPPAPSHSPTIGIGYRTDKMQVSFASAFRIASTSVSPADTDDDSADGMPDRYPCATCSKAGADYSLWLLGSYIDFSYDFDVPGLF
jgi:long-chain fatty acid transport protein